MAPRAPCDNLKQPATGRKRLYQAFAPSVDQVSQITESLSSAFRCSATVDRAGDGQCVGFCFGDVNARPLISTNDMAFSRPF
jgi:hypothetical protein